MAQQVRWGDQTFDLVQSPTFEEMSVIERAAGCGWDGLSSMEAAAGMVLVSLRRQGVILGWRDVLQLEPAQILVTDVGPDPTRAAESPAAPAPAAATLAALKDRENRTVLAAGGVPGEAPEGTVKVRRPRATKGTGSRAAAPSGNPARASRSKRSSTATS